MGIFSNKCSNPECGAKVKKNASYCSECGTPSSTGWATCGVCNASVGIDSTHCHRCGRELAESSRAQMYDSWWARDPEDFAVKLTAADIEGRLTKGLVIEEGTRGLIFQRGQLRGEVSPGKYDLDGFLHKLNNFNRTTPTTVVLIYDGDAPLELKYSQDDGIVTNEGVAVGAICNLVVKLDDPEEFFRNQFQSRIKMGFEELRELVRMEVLTILRASAKAVSIEDLWAETAFRSKMEEDLKAKLSLTLERTGLEFIQLRYVEFVGDEYLSEIKKKKGELFYLEARGKLNRRIRELTTQEKMAAFQDEKDFERFITQISHEMQMESLVRDNELVSLRQQFADDRDDHERARRHMIQRLELEHEIAVKRYRAVEEEKTTNEVWEIRAERLRNQLDFELAQEKKKRIEEAIAKAEREQAELKRRQEEAKTDHEIWLLKHEEERIETEFGQRTLERVKQIKLMEEKERLEMRLKEAEVMAKIEADKLKARSGATTEALLSILDGPQAEQLGDIEKLRIQQGMTPDQLIALVSEKSPHVADALKAKYQAEGQASDEIKQIYQNQVDQVRDDAEKNAQRLVDLAKELGKSGQGQQTIITGSPGGPTVIGSGGDVSSGGGQPKKVVICKNCERENLPESNFCINCGNQLK